MIDEKKLLSELEKWMNDTAYLKDKYSGSVQFKDGTGDNIMYSHAEIAHDVLSEVIDKINEQPKVGEWIPITLFSARKDLPANEEEVEITYTYRDYLNEKTAYGTARAFYEDGTINTEDSNFVWEDKDNWEYDEEKDAYIIPEEWWEYTKFAENCGIIDCKVIAWRPIQEPYREDNNV